MNILLRASEDVMKNRVNRMYGRRRVAAVLIAIVAGGLSSVEAHNGAVLPASINNSPGITIDGDSGVLEPGWGTGSPAGPSPNTCTEFLIGSGTPITFFATKDAANVYLRMSIPDNSLQADDRLFLFFDPDHAASPNLDKDVAFELPFGAALATKADVAGKKMFTGNATVWTAAAAFPAGVEVKYSRDVSTIVFEMKVPFATFTPPPSQFAASGFSFLYLNQTAIDPANDPTCAGIVVPPGELLAFKVAFPTTLPVGAVLPDSVNHASEWGDLGKDTGAVTFNTPVCCSNLDIQFPGFPGTTFPGDTDVDIEAFVHPGNGFPAKNVNVQIKVHDFGTGGNDIFNGMQPMPISSVAPGAPPAGVPTNPVTWHTPSSAVPVHTCVEAILLPPAVADDYSLAGMSVNAQRNADVAAVPAGSVRRLEFVTFNPDKTAAQTIRLVGQQQGPRPQGLTFQIVQPDRPVGSLQQARVALAVSADANLPPTDIPRQKLHVPPTAGRDDSVVIQMKGGDRLHLISTGDVDIDAGGAARPAGPDGVNVSDIVRGRFLLSIRTASRFGGALIGSFDGFETSFLVGSETTIAAPATGGSLRLAVNDVVGQNTDNTGRGFDVDAWTLAGVGGGDGGGGGDIGVVRRTTPGPSEPPFPGMRIVATSVQQVKVEGAARPYNIVNNLGALTYDVLVTDAVAGGKGKYLLWICLFVLLLVIAAIVVSKRGRTGRVPA
jgi:hypothetical protein